MLVNQLIQPPSTARQPISQDTCQHQCVNYKDCERRRNREDRNNCPLKALPVDSKQYCCEILVTEYLLCANISLADLVKAGYVMCAEPRFLSRKLFQLYDNNLSYIRWNLCVTLMLAMSDCVSIVSLEFGL
jgi:hypothetical protein